MGYTRPSGPIGNDCQVGHGWVEGWFDWLELGEVLNAAVAVLGKNCCKREEEKSRADILTVHCFFSLDHGLCLFAYSLPLLLFVDYS